MISSKQVLRNRIGLDRKNKQLTEYERIEKGGGCLFAIY